MILFGGALIFVCIIRFARHALRYSRLGSRSARVNALPGRFLPNLARTRKGPRPFAPLVWEAA